MTDEEPAPDTKKEPPPWLFPLVLGFIAVVGFFVAMEKIEGYRNQIDAAERFMPIEARILESEIKAVTNHRSGSTTNRTSYVPHIRYRYVVDGQGYKRSRYAYFHVNLGKSQAQEIVDQYPLGIRTRAFIDPEDPGHAVLNADNPENAWIMIVFFITFTAILLGIGGLVLRQFLRDRKS